MRKRAKKGNKRAMNREIEKKSKKNENIRQEANEEAGNEGTRSKEKLTPKQTADEGYYEGIRVVCTLAEVMRWTALDTPSRSLVSAWPGDRQVKQRKGEQV